MITHTVSNEGIVEVVDTENRDIKKITALKGGSTLVTFNYLDRSKIIKVNVKELDPTPLSITVDGTDLNGYKLTNGKSIILNLTTEGTVIDATVDKENIITFDKATNTLTGVSEGTGVLTITVQANGKKATEYKFNINVILEPVSYTIETENYDSETYVTTYTPTEDVLQTYDDLSTNLKVTTPGTVSAISSDTSVAGIFIIPVISPLSSGDAAETNETTNSTRFYITGGSSEGSAIITFTFTQEGKSETIKTITVNNAIREVVVPTYILDGIEIGGIGTVPLYSNDTLTINIINDEDIN